MNRRKTGASGQGSYKNYIDSYRELLVPAIYRGVEQEVEKAILDIEDKVKHNVRENLKGIPAMIHRLIQNIPPPPPGENPEGAFPELEIPTMFNPTDIFDNFDFGDTDGFDFGGFDETTSYLETSDSSGSSNFSDSHLSMPSSNTSVDDENYNVAKITRQPYQQPLSVLPEYSYPRGRC